ncbi:DUF1592 domain-containing protein [Marinagarivorans algicola]|uniref:DUF1592 domain-containing protein n=1 Tax=Marinagarivorans algicola TaxID=1513270 RepID=UPI0006B40441|nr:DUF1592 domain-containing protein [Marinagarivorans algicola]
MKLKYFVIACSLILLAACSAEPDESSNGGTASSQIPQSSSQTTSSSPAALDGAAIYDAQCKVCHGANGTDGFFPLNNDTLSFEQMVIETRDTMPDKKPEECDEACARAVTAYIKNDLLAGVTTPSSSQGQSSSAATVDPSMLTGKQLYEIDLGDGSCASCHGLDGEGIDSRGGSLLEQECESCQVSPSNLIAEVEATMPLRSAHLCVGECATKVSQYIYETFAKKTWAISACTNEINKASPMRRLNKGDIANAVQDVFGTGATEIKAALPNEQEVIGGFATVGSALTTSTDWTSALVNGAIDAADTIVDSGAFPQCNGAEPSMVDTGPKLGECSTTPQCQQMYAGATDCSNSQGGVCLCGNGLCSASGGTPSTGACFDEALATAGKLLFRRTLSAPEMTRFKTIRDNIRSKTGSEADGHKAVVVALLSSPKFVFSLAADKKTAARALTGSELADRLALTLWGSVPDETLIDVASRNELKGAQLDAQIDRMIADARFDRFAEFFGDAWLGLDGYLIKGADVNKTDAQWRALLADMKTETRTFLQHIIKNNLPVNEIYTAEYSFLNARLKEHYGFTVSGNNTKFVKTNYPNNSSRRGLMTQAAILAKAFDGSKTSVVKRGVLPLEAFTCTAPRPPTDNADVEEAINEQANSNATEKSKVADRASKNACASCHAVIDPLGWVFTEYGNAGESVNLDPDGDALNTSGSLYNQNFANAHGMVDIVVEEDKFASCFSNKFLIHSLGRKVSYTSSFEDQCAIDQAIKSVTVDGNVGARDLIKSLLRSNIATLTGTVEDL